jgi:hypothetical protein
VERAQIEWRGIAFVKKMSVGRFFGGMRDCVVYDVPFPVEEETFSASGRRTIHR